MKAALRGLLLLSLGFNAVLALSLVPRPGGAAAPPSRAAPPVLTRDSAVETTAPLPPVVYVTNRFHWRQLESSDYETFMANLRAVGCPEDTLRDIIVADVRKLYVHKLAAVPLQVGFWTGGQARQVASKARERRRRELSEERQALLHRLLGPAYLPNLDDEDDQVSDDLVRSAIMRFLVGPVPEATYRKITALMLAWDEESREISDEARPFPLPSDRQRLAELRRRKLEQLQTCLTPAQFAEFAERIAILTHDDDALEHLHFDAESWRRVAKARVAVYGPFDHGGIGFNGFESGQADTVLESMFIERLRSVLTEKQFAEYQRENDGAFTATRSIMQQNHLSEDLAIKVYEIRQALEAECRRVRESGGQDAAGLQTQLSSLQDTARNAVANLLGPKAYGDVLNTGQNGWLTNSIAP